MFEERAEQGEGFSLVRKPGLRLERRGLTLLLGGVLLLPILAVSIISATLPTAHDHPLNVTTRLVKPGTAGAAVVVHNQETVELASLRVELNGAYFHLPKGRLAPDAELELPLDWFAKKTGSTFDPRETPVRAIDISARLPGNRRAVYRETVERSVKEEGPAEGDR